MITRQSFDPHLYESVEIITTSVVVSSSIRTDFRTLLKSIRETVILEYETLVSKYVERAITKLELQCQEKELDGIYNLEIMIEPLHSGMILIFCQGDGVKKK